MKICWRSIRIVVRRHIVRLLDVPDPKSVDDVMNRSWSSVDPLLAFDECRAALFTVAEDHPFLRREFIAMLRGIVFDREPATESA